MIEIIEHGRTRELRLARPPANALSPDLLNEIRRAVEAAPADDVAALVLSGREGLFTGGLDVPLLLSLDRDGMADALEAFFGAMAALAASEVPVAAAITGHSPAGGAVLSLFCDWRVMARGDYIIGFNEVRIGIPMPTVVADAMVRVVGRHQAELLCQTGRMMKPDEALAVGLIDRIVEVDEVVPAALEFCAGFSELSARALRETRRTVRRDLIEIVERSRADNAREFADEWFKPELQESLRALAARLGK